MPSLPAFAVSSLPSKLEHTIDRTLTAEPLTFYSFSSNCDLANNSPEPFSGSIGLSLGWLSPFDCDPLIRSNYQDKVFEFAFLPGKTYPKTDLLRTLWTQDGHPAEIFSTCLPDSVLDKMTFSLSSPVRGEAEGSVTFDTNNDLLTEISLRSDRLDYDLTLTLDDQFIVDESVSPTVVQSWEGFSKTAKISFCQPSPSKVLQLSLSYPDHVTMTASLSASRI